MSRTGISRRRNRGDLRPAEGAADSTSQWDRCFDEFVASNAEQATRSFRPTMPVGAAAIPQVPIGIVSLTIPEAEHSSRSSARARARAHRHSVS